jgi:hypothetical protein
MTNSGMATATYTTQSSGGGSSPSYGSGFTSSGLTLNGSAFINGTRLELTNTTNQTASAFFNTLVNVQSFTTNFSFQLTNATAWGFTFTLQGNSPTAMGSGAANLAYSSRSGKAIGQSVAIKFCLQDASAGNVNTTGLYTDGTYPGSTGALDLTPSGVNLHSGDVMNVHMTYDGTTLTWTITDATTGASFTTSAAVAIPSFVGGNTAYVGFTGATGTLTAIQDILTWTYVSRSP